MSTDQRANIVVAETILKQLGANRFMAMTGAHTLVAHEDGLSFRLPGNAARGINYIRIRLAPEDLYEVEGGKIFTSRKVPRYAEIEKVCHVYAEDLCRIFTDMTGLDTSL